MTPKIQIVADGGSRNNQSAQDRQGYGSFVVLKDGVRSKITYSDAGNPRVVDAVHVDFGNQTNNYCEHGILAIALGYVQEVYLRARGSFPVEILMDSQLVVTQVNGTARIKNPNIADIATHNKLKLMSMPAVRLKWVDNTYIKSILGH
jgi:ribonuclease HI